MSTRHPLPEGEGRARRRNQGFTLLEVLVAMLIVSLIAAGLAASLHVASKARRSATLGMATVRAAQLAMETMGRDFQSTLPPPTPTSSTVLIGSFMAWSNGSALPGVGMGNSGQNTLAQSTVPLSGIGANNNIGPVGLGDSVTFSNTADPTRSVDGAGDVEQVTYALIKDSDLQLPTAANAPTLNGAPVGNSLGPSLGPAASGQGVLVRRVVRHLLAPQPETPVDQVICRNVKAFSLLFYDGTEWVTGWNSSSENNAVPTAIQVTLQIQPPDEDARVPGEPYTLTHVFAMPVSAETTIAGEAAPEP